MFSVYVYSHFDLALHCVCKQYPRVYIVYEDKRRNAKLSDYISNGRWVLPRPISADLVEVHNNMPSYVPSVANDDEAQWMLTTNVIFTVRSVWQRLRDVYPAVPWHGLEWHRDYIPYCSFIMWVVCKNKMRTRDKLLQWGKVDCSVCVLCGHEVETCDHLFFQCTFSKAVWGQVHVVLGSKRLKRVCKGIGEFQCKLDSVKLQWLQLCIVFGRSIIIGFLSIGVVL